MHPDTGRSDRIGSLIKKELAQLVAREIKDPRVGMASISAVKLSRDKSSALVYVAAAPHGQDSVQEAVQALNHAAGYLRKRLAEAVYLKRIPRLKFIYDESIERGARLDSLIDSLHVEHDS